MLFELFTQKCAWGDDVVEMADLLTMFPALTHTFDSTPTSVVSRHRRPQKIMKRIFGKFMTMTD